MTTAAQADPSPGDEGGTGEVDNTAGGLHRIGATPAATVPAGPAPEFSPLEVTDTATHTRWYTYVEPDPATAGPLPLVFAFHGGGGNMAVMYRALGFDNLPAPRPYLTVIPQGWNPKVGIAAQETAPPDEGIWNSGQSFAALQGSGPRDDVAFFDALLLEVTRRAATAGRRIDQSRTYAIGFSNGGMMTYRLAAERSADLAAVAVMQASIGGHPNPGNPVRRFHINHPADHAAEPVSVLQLHGLVDPGISLADGLIPTGRNPRTDLPVIDAVDTWVAHNNCDRNPSVEPHHNGVMRTWANGDKGTRVKLLTMPEVGHEVPAGAMHLIEPFLLGTSK
ncbi:MAG: hypothetical protein AAGA65_08675 [Actinomycetota bacterium]